MQSNGVADNVGGSLQGGIPASGILGMQGMAPMAPMGGPPIMPNPEGAQQFCLRWNSYPATVATQLAALRAAEDFVDVTLACDGRQLRAHKLVLSACSPYFMQLFKSTPCQHPVIFLRDVGFRQLVALLEFMYAGEVNVSQVELPALLRTAEALQVRGLADTTPNNNNNNPCTVPPKPAYSPTYGQQVGTPVMTNVPSVPITTEQPVCPEVPSNPQPGPAQKSSRREERSNAGNKQRDGGEEENSNDSMESHEDFEVTDAEMKPFGNDENAPEQVDETSNTFQNEPDDQEAGRVTTNQSGIGNASTAGSQSEEETSEEEEDDDDGDCKDFPYQSDASYGQDNIPEGGNSANGENPGPSGGSAADGDGDGSIPLVPCKGEGNGGAGNGGNSRNRLSRSLWPPGIPYHGPQQCPYCPRVLSNVGNWRKHVLTMHFAREKNYKCRHCASSFRTAEYLQKHYVRVHNYPQKMTRRKYVEQT